MNRMGLRTMTPKGMANLFLAQVALLLLVSSPGNLGIVPLAADECHKDCGCASANAINHRMCGSPYDCHVTQCARSNAHPSFCWDEQDTFADYCAWSDDGPDCTYVWFHQCPGNKCL